MPISPSASQSDASRANGARSSGPVTAEGKAVSARNAHRHGLRSGKLLLEREEEAWLEELLAELVRAFRPQGAVEQTIVEALALSEIKLARLDRLELEALVAAADPEADPRLARLATLARYGSRLSRERADLQRRLSDLQERRRMADPAVRASLLASLCSHGEPAPPIAQTNPSVPADPTPSAPPNRHERRRRGKLARAAA
jgi:hypothetical protein